MARLLIVPAAGRGTRLGGAIPKVLVAVDGVPMLRRVLDLHAPWVERAIVVAHPSAAADVAACAREGGVPAEVVVQEAPTGMLDAVLIGMATAATHTPGRVWISWGDQVAVHPLTLERLAGVEEGSDLALPTVLARSPYIHLARDACGRVVRVLQQREGDEMPEAGEGDLGVFSLSRRACFEELPRYAREAAPGRGTAERNFLPFIAWMAARGVVATCGCTDAREAVGINTPDDLARVAAYLASRD